MGGVGQRGQKSRMWRIGRILPCRQQAQAAVRASRSRPLKKGVVSPQSAIPAGIEIPPYAFGGMSSKATRFAQPTLLSPAAIDIMRTVGEMTRKAREFAGSLVEPGITTDQIDKEVHAFIVGMGAYPAPLGYHGFPKSLCTSVNEVLCHGIPDDRPLAAGDLVNCDVTLFYQGYHGDSSATFAVGAVDKDAQLLMRTAEEAMYRGIAACGVGHKFSEIADAISAHVRSVSSTYSVSPDFCGHGIGALFHLPPLVVHTPHRGSERMKVGQAFTIEPIVCERSAKYHVWNDDWTAVTKDGGWTAQFEHTILMTETGPEILT